MTYEQILRGIADSLQGDEREYNQRTYEEKEIFWEGLRSDVESKLNEENKWKVKKQQQKTK